MQFCSILCRLSWHHQQPELQPILPLQCHASCAARHCAHVSKFPEAFLPLVLIASSSYKGVRPVIGEHVAAVGSLDCPDIADLSVPTSSLSGLITKCVCCMHSASMSSCLCTCCPDRFSECRLPGLFENLFRPPTSGIGLQVYINIYNSIWLFVFVSVAYGVVSARKTCCMQYFIHLPSTADFVKCLEL